MFFEGSKLPNVTWIKFRDLTDVKRDFHMKKLQAIS